MGKSDNNPLKVSILLPTYNRGFLLNSCTDSVINQTYKNWELIIADDGSSDDTPNIAKKILIKDTRIKFHRNCTNLGLPSNRNVSLSLASGELIWFIEDDMILECDCLKCLVETWIKINEKEQRLGVICPSLISYEQTKGARRDILNFTRELKKKELKDNPCFVDKWTGLIFRNFSPNFNQIVEIQDSHSCSIYKKDIFEKLSFNNTAYCGNFIGEESDFHFKLRKMGYKIFFQPKAILNHHTVNFGGCRLPLLKWSYFFIKNHIIFLKRNYGVKSIYMIPFFLTYNLTVLIRYIIRGIYIERWKNLDKY